MKSTIWSLEAARKKHRQSAGIAQELSSWLPREDPILDLGCGTGYYLSILAAGGYRCLGVEGTPDIEQIAYFADIRTADLAAPLTIDWPRSSLLCLEVAEHLHPQQEAALLHSIDTYCRRVLVLSWAVPGQRGTGHVNCRPNSYVHEQVCKRGFELWPAATFALREAAEEHVRYFRNSLLVFMRRTHDAPPAS